MPARRTLADARNMFFGEPGKCWYLSNDPGKNHGTGYNLLTVSGKRWYAHRLAYFLFKGEIPNGKEIDHVCHNVDPMCPGGSVCKHRKCVNPDHLEAVTKKTNILRGKSPPAINNRRILCKNGHDLGERRSCQVCRNERRHETGEIGQAGRPETRTFCPSGHEYNKENTYICIDRITGKFKCRMCRSCARNRYRANREKKINNRDI